MKRWIKIHSGVALFVFSFVLIAFGTTQGLHWSIIISSFIGKAALMFSGMALFFRNLWKLNEKE